METTSKKYDFSSIMSSAWQLFKANSTTSFSDCLKKAWVAFKAKAAMKAGRVHFLYKKVDGTIRDAFGTLTGFTYERKTTGERKPNFKTIAYFDLGKMAWKSFTIANFIGVVK